jgi:hypothetical protein
MYVVSSNSIDYSEAKGQEPRNYTLDGLKILARLIANDLLTKRSELVKNDNANLNITETLADSNENLS